MYLSFFLNNKLLFYKKAFSMNSIINLENLSIFYENFRVLKNISMSLESGTIGLLGPNGAGKTSLIKTLMGLHPFFTGEVEVLGINVKKNPLEVRTKIGYVPEGEAYINNISSVQLVTFLGELAGIDSKTALKRAHEVLEYVNLGEERYRKIDELSHGQQSRVKLAQALVHNAELLILDEPTDGMDPLKKQKFLDLVKRIQKETTISILLASHTLEDVEKLCDKIILLNEGEIIGIKDIEELNYTHQNIYVVHLTDNSKKFIDLCKEKQIKVKEVYGSKVLLENIKETQNIFSLALQADCGISSFYPWIPSLESIFLEMIK